MKVLVAADWHGEIYAEAFYKAFKKLDYDTYSFSWKEYFKHYQYASRYPTDGSKLKSLYYRLQNKLLVGPELNKINRDFLKKCEEVQPDLVFIYRGTHIYPSTITRIKHRCNCKVFGYNNDDPFSDQYPSYVWRYYKRSIPLYDHIFSYRYKNIEDYKQVGYTKVSMLRSYYLSDKNFHVTNIVNSDYLSDVSFIGHYENDGRDETLRYLLENGINLKLFGTSWENSLHYSYFIKKLGPIKAVYDDYNLALNSCKVALVFLSKLNNDTSV